MRDMDFSNNKGWPLGKKVNSGYIPSFLPARQAKVTGEPENVLHFQNYAHKVIPERKP